MSTKERKLVRHSEDVKKCSDREKPCVGPRGEKGDVGPSSRTLSYRWDGFSASTLQSTGWVGTDTLANPTCVFIYYDGPIGLVDVDFLLRFVNGTTLSGQLSIEEVQPENWNVANATSLPMVLSSTVVTTGEGYGTTVPVVAPVGTPVLSYSFSSPTTVLTSTGTMGIGFSLTTTFSPSTWLLRFSPGQTNDGGLLRALSLITNSH